MRHLTHPRSARHAMSLIELMIVVSVLAILAAIVVPMFGSTSDVARTEAMASNATQIKSLIIQHAGARDVPLSAQGYPQSIDGTWFKMGHLPDHSWNNGPLIIEVVNAAVDQIYPAVKTFDPSVVGDKSAWYNTANGRFIVRVPAQSSPASTLHLFNSVNKIDTTSLNQTKR